MSSLDCVLMENILVWIDTIEIDIGVCQWWCSQDAQRSLGLIALVNIVDALENLRKSFGFQGRVDGSGCTAQYMQLQMLGVP